jgi:hypothetical protein
MISMIGLAARPGTEVDPMCSDARARSPGAAWMRWGSRSNNRDYESSYGTMVIEPLTGVGA